MFSAEGVLEYTDHGLRVLVDEEISSYYRSFIPKGINLNRQRHPAHITVVRHEDVFNHPKWKSRENEIVPFQYENTVYNGEVYFWLNVYSRELEKIRLELDLPITSWYTRPPGEYKRCFHITIANKK